MRVDPICLTEACPSFQDTSHHRVTSILKAHQRVLLQRCVEAETGSLRWEGRRLDTRMAIMGDKVGSGKSFVIMALVFSTDHTPSHVDDVHIFDRGVVMLTEDRSAAEHLPLLEDGDDGSAADDDGAASRTWSYLPPSFPVVPTRQAKTSLLVVPHILFGQWTDYLKTYAPCEARWPASTTRARFETWNRRDPTRSTSSS